LMVGVLEIVILFRMFLIEIQMHQKRFQRRDQRRFT